MKICTKCILQENYPGITFNEDGVCNYCLTYEEREYLGDEELIKFIRSYKKSDQTYDCLIGLSGGRDSSYLLYYLANVLNLNVLAYHFDHGFIPEETKLNVRNAADILNVKLVIEKSDILKKCIKHHIMAWMRRPTPAMIGMLCTGCRLGTDRGLVITARKYKVPYIAYGGHPHEGTGFKLRLLKGNLESRARNLFLIYGYLSEIIKNPYWIMNPTCFITQIKEYVSHFSPLRRIAEKMRYTRVKSSSPFYRFIEWNEEKVLSTIQKELKWQNPAYGESTWRTDCTISILKNYLYKETLGFSDKDDGLSCLVRAGQITREEAINRSSKENEVPEEFIASFFKEHGLRLSGLQAALKKSRERQYYKQKR